MIITPLKISALASRNNQRRYFSTITGTEYYTIPTVTLTGDFEIEFDCSTTVGGTVIGQSSVNFMRVNNDTTFDMRIGGATISTFTTSGLLNGKLNNIKVVRVGSTVEVFHNGVSIGTATDSDTCTIENIGRYPSTSYFNGVIANVKITDAGTLIRNYPINEDLSTTSTIIDNGSDGSNGTAVSITSSELFTLVGSDWIGAELVVNGDFATDSDWTKGTGVTISGGEAILNFTTAYGFPLQQNSVTVVGQTYKTVFEITDYVSDSVRLRLGDGNGTARSANGVYTQILTSASNVNLFFQNAAGTVVMNIDNVSVKRILQAP